MTLSVFFRRFESVRRRQRFSVCAHRRLRSFHFISFSFFMLPVIPDRLPCLTYAQKTDIILIHSGASVTEHTLAIHITERFIPDYTRSAISPMNYLLIRKLPDWI